MPNQVKNREKKKCGFVCVCVSHSKVISISDFSFDGCLLVASFSSQASVRQVAQYFCIPFLSFDRSSRRSGFFFLSFISLIPYNRKNKNEIHVCFIVLRI